MASLTDKKFESSLVFFKDEYTDIDEYIDIGEYMDNT